MKWALWLVTAALCVVARPARAEDDGQRPSYRVVVDRVDHEPAVIGGTRLRVYVSALTLNGGRLALDPKSIKTYAGTSALDAPVAIGTYGAAGGATAIVVVVQATLDYAEVLPVIVETLDTGVLSTLDDDTQVAVLAYGDAVGAGKLRTPKAASAALKQLANDGSAGEPALLETVERAMRLLRKARTKPEGRPLRKVLIVIGDGRDRAADRDRVTRLGARAAKEGVRIHSFAYSPSDQRRPLLLLGELSKRSLGTFRWLRGSKAESWTPAFAQLRDELDKQYVLTYFLSADQDPTGKKLEVRTTGRAETTSLNQVRVPEATCDGEACAGYCAGDVCAIPRLEEGRGILGWILWIVGGAVALILVLGLIGFAMSKRTKPIPLPPGVVMPGQAPMPQPQLPVAQAAPGRMVPHLMFMAGPRAGERIPLRHGFLVGKAPGCDLLIEDGYTSSHHAQFAMDHAGHVRLYDRGSTNGTYVNGARISEAPLEHGATIRFGSTDVRFLAQ
jgi:hypothetical protein